MNNQQIGEKLVTYSNQDRADLAVDELYGEDIVSIEVDGNTVVGIAAVRDKHAGWYDNNEVHSAVAEGPYVGHDADKFVVRFAVDVTPKGGERGQFSEVGIYTVTGGKIVREEFLPLAG